MERLPAGEYLKKSVSPDSKYTLTFYLCNGGATVDYSVRGELSFNNTSRNIYWDYKSKNVNITWIDNNTVNVNGHILNLPNDIWFQTHFQIIVLFGNLC